MLRRADRRTRRQRLTAGLLGLSAGAVSVAVTASLLGSLGSQPDERPTPNRTTTVEGALPPGTITAPADAIPEGRLVLQTNSGIEVVAQGDDESVSIGDGAIFAYDTSPDTGDILAATYVTPNNYTREDQLLTIYPSTGERTVLVRAGPKEDLGPAVWSPDGQRVAYRLTVLAVDPAMQHPGENTVEQTICVVDVATRTPQCFPDLGTVDGFDWSPDGRRIAIDGVGADLPLRFLDVETGVVSDFASPLDPDLVAALGGEPPGSLVDVAWSPSGMYVATQAHLFAPAIFDSDGRFVMLGHRTQEFSEIFAWSPTQDLLVYANGRPPYAITHVYLLDPATGQDRLLFSTGEGEHAPIITDAAWSPSGRWLAVAVVERTPYLPMSVHIIDVSGGGPTSIVDVGASDRDVLVGWGP